MPKQGTKPGKVNYQKTKPVNTIHNPERSAKPPSPVQILAAPPNLSGLFRRHQLHRHAARHACAFEIAIGGDSCARISDGPRAIKLRRTVMEGHLGDVTRAVVNDFELGDADLSRVTEGITRPLSQRLPSGRRDRLLAGHGRHRLAFLSGRGS